MIVSEPQVTEKVRELEKRKMEGTSLRWALM